MSRFYRDDGRPDLERFEETYLEWYDSRRRTKRLRRKQRASRTADLYDTVDMIDLLMDKHQSTFYNDERYKWRLTFPYLFLKPKVGDKILNKTTGEEYKILWVEELSPTAYRPAYGPVVDAQSGLGFTGTVIIDQGVRAPNPWDDLEFVDKENRYIRFFEWGGSRNTQEPISSADADTSEKGHTFVPSITWTLKRKEPGSIGKDPFGRAKELKPRLREQFPDPQYTYLVDEPEFEDAKALAAGHFETGSPIITGSWVSIAEKEAAQHPMASTHTIEVYGQWFDNIVQFDCWSTSNPQANMLVTWFEDFMELYIPILKRNGVQEALYWQRQDDKVLQAFRDDIDNRTVQYYFRTEKLRVHRSRNFRNYSVRVRLAARSESLIHGEPSGITTVSGVYGVPPYDKSMQQDYLTGVHSTGSGDYPWGSMEIQDLGFTS
jgi:hypothetical protein